MILSTSKIKELLSVRYPSIAYLETNNKTTGRYKEKDIILFEYTNAAGEAVVLKFFSLQRLEEDEKQQEMQDLLTEYQTIRRFGTHRNIVRVYDANELDHDGTLIGFYITMEKFDATLADLLQQNQRFSEDQVKEFLRQMDDVLQTAHYKLLEPVVHSDIKPANIGIRQTAAGYEYALMDFDVSVALERANEDSASFTLSNKATMRGLSPAYAPPEQVMAYLHKTGSISNRVDVYAVGAIAMQMLTGIPPKKDEQKIYYTLPFDELSSGWYDYLKILCNPNKNDRSKVIGSESIKLIMDGRTSTSSYKDFYGKQEDSHSNETMRMTDVFPSSNKAFRVSLNKSKKFVTVNVIDIINNKHPIHVFLDKVKVAELRKSEKTTIEIQEKNKLLKACYNSKCIYINTKKLRNNEIIEIDLKGNYKICRDLMYFTFLLSLIFSFILAAEAGLTGFIGIMTIWFFIYLIASMFFIGSMNPLKINRKSVINKNK